jgi:hypothetical protein
MILSVTILAVTTVAETILAGRIIALQSITAVHAEGGPAMTRGEAGHQPQENTGERLDAAQGSPGHDPTLLALEELVAAAEQVARMSAHVTDRAGHIRTRRLEGRPYRQIVAGENGPLIAAQLTENIQRLEAAGTRFRQAEAAALHEEGMTMEEIGQLFGLTRQRISTLIRAASAPPPAQAPLPATAATPILPDESGDPRS